MQKHQIILAVINIVAEQFEQNKITALRFVQFLQLSSSIPSLEKNLQNTDICKKANSCVMKQRDCETSLGPLES
jgi:hypothetical protein